MEDKVKIGRPADELQFCSATESSHPQYVLTKPSKSVKWHMVLLAFVTTLVIALVVMASYLVATQHDCDVYFDENDRDDLPQQHHPPNEYNGSLIHSVDTLTEQERNNLEFVSRLDCLQVNGVLKRLRKQVRITDISNFDSVEKFKLHEYILARASQLRCNVDDEVNALEIAGEEVDDRELVCQESYVGDGWCDLSCNNEKYDFDGGDCCYSSCVAKSRELPCGINGYGCNRSVAMGGPPYWFTTRTQLCYQWYADGDGGQCGGGAAQRLCAYVNQFTNYYRDDTDDRSGGCRMSWGVFASGADSWFNQVQLCYTWYADGDGGQCLGTREVCAPVNSYTDYYRDDTDGRSGGCRMSWRLRVPAAVPSWMYNVKLCYQWYADGDGGQCGGGVSTLLCAYTDLWTPYYRDDTDGRSGGCQMKWGLFL